MAMRERLVYHSALGSLRLVFKVVVGLLSCYCSNSFVPSGHRLGTGAVVHRTRITRCSTSWSMKTAPERGVSKTYPMLPHVALACLATATILSASEPVEAMLSGSPTSMGASVQHRDWASTTVLLSENEEASTLDSSALTVAPSATNDIPGLVSELRGSPRPDGVLSAMIKINDMVNADTDGLNEDTVAKEDVVRALLDKRRAGGEAWDSDNEIAFGILKRKLDPYNVVVLRPYLQIAPFLGGVYYLAAFFVQQRVRAFFPAAYFAAVGVFLAPALILILTN